MLANINLQMVEDLKQIKGLNDNVSNCYKTECEGKDFSYCNHFCDLHACAFIFQMQFLKRNLSAYKNLYPSETNFKLPFQKVCSINFFSVVCINKLLLITCLCVLALQSVIRCL